MDQKITIRTTDDGITTVMYELVKSESHPTLVGVRDSKRIKTRYAIDYPGLVFMINRLIEHGAGPSDIVD